MPSNDLIIPAINGLLEIGLSATADTGTSADDRLVVSRGERNNSAKTSTTSALRIAARLYPGNHEVKILMVNAAYAICGCNLISSDIGSSDWTGGDISVTADEAASVNVILVESDIRRALVLVVGTKISYWLTNHHTGGSVVVGYIKKLKEAICRTIPDSIATKMLHTIGHWADTRLVLRKLGIPGIVGPATMFQHAIFDFTAQDDMCLRVRSLPAGTHKVAACYEVIKRLVNHPLSAVYPNIGSLKTVVDLYRRINATPARYHVGSFFLTRETRIDISVDTMPIGTLGTFLKTCFPKSTLVGSAVFTRNAQDVYKDHDSFDANFESFCRSYVLSAAKLIDNEQVKEIVNSAAEVNAPDVIREVMQERNDNANI